MHAAVRWKNILNGFIHRCAVWLSRIILTTHNPTYSRHTHMQLNFFWSLMKPVDHRFIIYIYSKMTNDEAYKVKFVHIYMFTYTQHTHTHIYIYIY